MHRSRSGEHGAAPFMELHYRGVEQGQLSGRQDAAIGPPAISQTTIARMPRGVRDAFTRTGEP
jgi:hypothetical protein